MARWSAWVFAAVLAPALGGLQACSLISLDALDSASASSDATANDGAPDATLGLPDEAGAPGDDGNSSEMTSSDSAEPADSTVPPDSGSSQAGPEGGTEDAASEAESSIVLEASADVSAPIDAGGSDAATVGCASGSPLARGGWATNPGTSASDSICSAIDGIYNMFDGLLTTRWSTARVQATAPAEWLAIDLGCAQTFSELVLDATNYTLDYPRGYTVQVSTDGTTWSQVATGAGSSALTKITFSPTTARYVKVLQTGTSASFWSIDELNVCGTTTGICAAAPIAYSRASWATNPGTSVSDNTAALGNMFDGSPSTRWTTNRQQEVAPPEWVEVDMGVSQPVSQVMLQNFDDCDDYPRTVVVQVSPDNATWTQVATGPGSTPFTTISFAPTTARYVKLTETGQTISYWSIDELLLLH